MELLLLLLPPLMLLLQRLMMGRRQQLQRRHLKLQCAFEAAHQASERLANHAARSEETFAKDTRRETTSPSGKASGVERQGYRWCCMKEQFIDGADLIPTERALRSFRRVNKIPALVGAIDRPSWLSGEHNNCLPSGALQK
jgi:hypothetical protein